MAVNTSQTDFIDAINIVLSNIGESPVTSVTGNTTTDPKQVNLAIDVINEVSNDIQARGWWFNTDSSGNVTLYQNTATAWNAAIKQEARRYIAIRAARILQARVIGAEELQKFSHNEELVSLAVLHQAHVNDSSTVSSFTSYPQELKQLGLDEFMFLQSTLEEKIHTIKIAIDVATIEKTKRETDVLEEQKSLLEYQQLSELQNATKTGAEKLLVDAQELKVDKEAEVLAQQKLLLINQTATELKRALDIVADSTVKGKQGSLIDKQALTEVQNALKVIAETSLLNDQEALVVKQALTEVAKATDIGADTTLKGKQGSLVDNQAATELKEALLKVEQATLVEKQGLTEVKKALDVVADTTIKGKQGSFIDNQAATELKRALDLVADTTLKGKQGSLVDNQAATELKRALDIVQDTIVKTGQKTLLDKQATTEEKEAALKVKQATLLHNQAQSELKKALDLVADTTLKGKQGSFVDNQAATELKRALDIVADTTIKGKQGSLVDNQAATELKRALDLVADTTVKGKQGTFIDNQAATELKKALDIVADTTLKGKQGSLVDNQSATELKRALDLVADTTLKGKQGSLIDNQAASELKQAAVLVKQATLLQAQATTETNQALNIAADTTLKGKQGLVADKQALDIVADTSLKEAQKAFVDKQALTEVKRALDIVADTTLKTSQTSFVDKQALTEVQRALDVAADVTLKGKQGSLIDTQAVDVAADSTLKGKQVSLIDKQVDTEEAVEQKTFAEKNLIVMQQGLTNKQSLTEQARKLDVEQDTDLKEAQEALLQSQKAELDLKTALELTVEKNYFDRVLTRDQATYSDYAGEFRIMGINEESTPRKPMGFTQLPAYKKKELFVDAIKMRVQRAPTSDSETATSADKYLTPLNNILRLIGEAPVTIVRGNSLSVEAFKLRKQIDREIQSRGWWFNTFINREFTASGGIIDVSAITPEILNIELDDTPTRLGSGANGGYLVNAEDNTHDEWTGTVKGTVIQLIPYESLPEKFKQYLEVRTAKTLCQMYPRSPEDVTRLQLMEKEIETYFNDRENDNANYNIMNSYDVSRRVGINRNYRLV